MVLLVRLSWLAPLSSVEDSQFRALAFPNMLHRPMQGTATIDSNESKPYYHYHVSLLSCLAETCRTAVLDEGVGLGLVFPHELRVQAPTDQILELHAYRKP